VARQLRKKYATALWISCEELCLHLEEIQHKISQKNTKALDALRKIPDHDFNNRVDWFTKHGYYTTVTAYRIAVVSCWLFIYQRDISRPMSFGAFCDRCFSDKAFRKFYEQLHMFISFIATERYPGTIDQIRTALRDLTGFLEKENLLTGLKLKRSTIDPELTGPE
jgi:hypothetical protein